MWNDKRPKLCGQRGLAWTWTIYGQPSPPTSMILNSFLCKPGIKHTLCNVVVKTSWDNVQGAPPAQWCISLREAQLPLWNDTHESRANFPRKKEGERRNKRTQFHFMWKTQSMRQGGLSQPRGLSLHLISKQLPTSVWQRAHLLVYQTVSHMLCEKAKRFTYFFHSILP